MATFPPPMAWTWPVRLLLGAALSTFLFAGAFRAMIESAYYVDLTGRGLQPIHFTLFLLAAPLLLAFPPLGGHPRRVLLGAALLLVLSRVAMPFARGNDVELHLVLSALSAGAFLLLLPVLARVARGQPGDEGAATMALGLALGWLADVVLLVAFGTLDRAATLPGLLLIVPLGLGLLALLRAPATPPSSTVAHDVRVPAWKAILAGVGLGGALFLQHAILLAPHLTSRWGHHAYGLALAGTLLGLAAGAWLLLRGTRASVAALALANVGALLAIALHGTVVPAPLAALAQAVLVLDVAVLLALLARADLRVAGIGLGLGGAIVVALHAALLFGYGTVRLTLLPTWEMKTAAGAAIGLLLASLAVLAAPRLDLRPRSLPRRPAIALGLVLLLAPAPTLAAQGADVETPREDESIRVLTYNVHQGFNNHGAPDPDLIARILRDADADVIAIQETGAFRYPGSLYDLLHLLSRDLGYHAYPGSDEPSPGLGLLSRYPILSATQHPLPSTGDPRAVLEAELDVHGKPIWIHVTHLGLRPDDRIRQIETILARAATRTPSILAGDLNICPDGNCWGSRGPDDIYQRITRHYEDPLVATHGDKNDTAGLSFRSNNPIRRIDYVFVTPELQATSYRVIRTQDTADASDHLPVVVELRRS